MLLPVAEPADCALPCDMASNIADHGTYGISSIGKMVNKMIWKANSGTIAKMKKPNTW